MDFNGVSLKYPTGHVSPLLLVNIKTMGGIIENYKYNSGLKCLAWVTYLNFKGCACLKGFKCRRNTFAPTAASIKTIKSGSGFTTAGLHAARLG